MSDIRTITPITIEPPQVKPNGRKVLASEAPPQALVADEIRCLSADDVAALPRIVTYPIHGFGLPAGAVCVWGAVSFAGKSIVLQDMLLAVASGEKVWGEFRAEPGRVVHIDMEQGDDGTVDRYRRLARPRNVDFDALYRSGAIRITTRRVSGVAGILSSPDRAVAPGVEDRYQRLLDGCSFAFIDTLAASTPDSEENDKMAGEVIYALGRVAQKTGCTIVLAHHFTKASMSKDASEHPQAWFRGHGSIFAAADYAFAMTGKAGEPRKVQKAKGRSMGDPLTPDFFLDYSTVRVEGYDAATLNPGNVGDPGGFAVRYRTAEAIEAERAGTPSAAIDLRLDILEHIHRKRVTESVRFRSGTELKTSLKRNKQGVLDALRDLRGQGLVTDRGPIEITESGYVFFSSKAGRPL